jgi:hypothetical protein
MIVDRMMLFGLLLAGVFILLFVIADYRDQLEVGEMAKRCENKGGTLLDHTRQLGKVTNHNYVCIDSTVIIKY